jgi:YihY family inner membrane protein
MYKLLFGPMLADKIDRLGTYAAALAYCFVLSLIPFLVVTFTLASQFAPSNLNLSVAYSDLLNSILPSTSTVAEQNSHDKAANLSTQIINTLQATSHRGLATVGFILAVYTSYNLMNQIVRTLLFIFDDPRRPQEWTWVVGLKTAALGLIWMFLLLLISFVSLVTPIFQSVLRQLHLDSELWTAPILVGRDVTLVLSLFGAFFLTYLLVPSRRYGFGSVRNGSIVAAIGWVGCSLVFAYVLPNVWGSNAVYEALGSVVVILIWAQACAWSVIAGACWIVRFGPVPRAR